MAHRQECLIKAQCAVLKWGNATSIVCSLQFFEVLFGLSQLDLQETLDCFVAECCDAGMKISIVKSQTQVFITGLRLLRHFQQSLQFRPLNLVRMSTSTPPTLFKGEKHLEDVFGGAQHGTTASREARVRCLCNYYQELKGEDRVVFLRHLAMNFGVDGQSIRKKAQQLLELTMMDLGNRLQVEEQLRESLTPKYLTIFHEIGRFEGGVKFLVDLRTDLLDLLSMTEMGTDIVHHTKALSTAVKNLLALWFSVGFLHLQRVTWDSSCDMLQKISDYEAVHPIRNWTDLKRRVGMYRRCYVFTHNSMPREPIVVLHTALMDNISDSIKSIVAYQRQHSEGDITLNKPLRKEDPRKVKAAVFYSITSTQKGLIGIELGNYLIKQVVKEVQTEFPLLKQFSSLSPIPGFKDWLLAEMLKVEKGTTSGLVLLSEEEQCNIQKHLESTKEDFWADLRKNVAKNWWMHDIILQEMLAPALHRLCAHYLYRVKRRGYALNSVANFHLKNGAVMWRINWKADWSPRGMSNSCGMMVNYRYFLEDTEENSERYFKEQYIKISEHVSKLLDQQSVSSS